MDRKSDWEPSFKYTSTNEYERTEDGIKITTQFNGFDEPEKIDASNFDADELFDIAHKAGISDGMKVCAGFNANAKAESTVFEYGKILSEKTGKSINHFFPHFVNEAPETNPDTTDKGPFDLQNPFSKLTKKQRKRLRNDKRKQRKRNPNGNVIESSESDE